MSVALHAIESYVKPPNVSCTNSPFCKVLTGWMEPEFEFNAPNVGSSTLRQYGTNGVNHKIVAFDGVALKKARAEALAVAQSKNSRTDAEWASALKDAYANFKTSSDQAKFNVLLGCPIVNIVFDAGKVDLGELATGTETSFQELDQILKLPTRDGSFFLENDGLLWDSLTKKTSGLFFPLRWREKDAGQFVEAKDLYRQGKDVPRILKLLAESISLTPISSEKWSYLGGTLKVAGRNEDAIIAYVQALRLDSTNKWAWKGLRSCCEKSGFINNAKGLGWYLKLIGIE